MPGETIRFIHTSDWQLGAGFGRVPGDKGALLRSQRLATIERIGHLAAERDADFVLVAGDLFDAHTIENEVVTLTLEKLSRYPVPAFVIPGNHDFSGTPESVYQRERFRNRKPDNLVILDAAEPEYVAPHNTVILPCPLIQRHTVADPTQWMTRESGRELSDDAFRIGLAHGSVIDFDSEDGGTTPNLIDVAVTTRAGLDYLALGDWHGTKQITDRSWYSGTPEPDRFKENKAGNVLLVEIASPGALPQVEVIPVAGCRWLRHTATLHGAADLEHLEQWFSRLADAERTLLRLELDGVLGMESMRHLSDLLETQSELLLHLRQRGAGVQLRPTDDEIERMSGEGLTGRVVESLRVTIVAGGDDAERAAVALQVLFQLGRSAAGAITHDAGGTP